MIAILWRYRVREECRSAFEAAYGATGDWSQLFARTPGYLGTALLRGEDGGYLTIDRWRDAGDFESFLTTHRNAYRQLDEQCGEWTLAEERLGVFTTHDL